MLLIIQIKLTIGACQIFKKKELMQVFATAIVHQRQNIWGTQEHLKLSKQFAETKHTGDKAVLRWFTLSRPNTEQSTLYGTANRPYNNLKVKNQYADCAGEKMCVGYTAQHQVSSHSVTDPFQSVYSFAWSWLITDECVLQRDYQPVWVIWEHHRVEEPRREAGLAKAPGNSRSHSKQGFLRSR